MRGTVWFLFVISRFMVGAAAPAGESFPFDEYQAGPLFHGRPAVPRAETPLARDHTDIIRKAVRRGPNFAGHYTVVNWGCGSSCGTYVIVDNRTGRIYEPQEISKGVELGVAGPEHRPNSTLMVVASCPPPEQYGYKNCERKFYKWNGSKLILLKTEPVNSATQKSP
jgi:hypothetical protein